MFTQYLLQNGQEFLYRNDLFKNIPQTVKLIEYGKNVILKVTRPKLKKVLNTVAGLKFNQ